MYALKTPVVFVFSNDHCLESLSPLLINSPPLSATSESARSNVQPALCGVGRTVEQDQYASKCHAAARQDNGQVKTAGPLSHPSGASGTYHLSEGECRSQDGRYSAPSAMVRAVIPIKVHPKMAEAASMPTGPVDMTLKKRPHAWLIYAKTLTLRHPNRTAAARQ